MSQCKKFAPNIFHKTKCSNCFRQKEEHTAEALECNRASRSVARSGYLFVAPDWDFSVPLNRTKRWQRRWFVLYDDGELSYSVDEHPDTVPQGSVDMSKVLEVTGAEQITGHPHSLALTGPDRVTFVKAASREDARWWAELLAVFPRRHKRNATFPGGRASPSLPQLGRSASPQPPRARHLSYIGPSTRTNFTSTTYKEDRCAGSRIIVSPKVSTNIVTPTSSWLIEPNRLIEAKLPRTDYVTASLPPFGVKLKDEDIACPSRAKEKFKDLATALTNHSPETAVAVPVEGQLNLKKGWLWCREKSVENDWLRRWWVLCEQTLRAYTDQDDQSFPEITIELPTISGITEVATDVRIRSSWVQALRKALPIIDSPPAPATPRSCLFSSDEEYRTASEGGRRDSEDWGDMPSSPPSPKTIFAKAKDKSRLRNKLPKSQSKQSTVDSIPTDETDGYKQSDEIEIKNTVNKQAVEIDGLKQQLSCAVNKMHNLEIQLARYKELQSETAAREQQTTELVKKLEKVESSMNQKLKQVEEKYNYDQKMLHSQLTEAKQFIERMQDKCLNLKRELQVREKITSNLQSELDCLNEKYCKTQQENDHLSKKLQEIENKSYRRKRLNSLTELVDINQDSSLESLSHAELIEQCLDLRNRLETAVIEIKAMKKELRESHVKYDRLELETVGLKNNLQMLEQEGLAQSALMADRVQDLTMKLATAEKQARNLKSKLQDSREKRRSLSLKGRESISINKEIEDKIAELETKIVALEKNKSRRKHRRERSSERMSPIENKFQQRIRRKSLDSVTSFEPIKLFMRLHNLERKITNVTSSNESLNYSEVKTDERGSTNLYAECVILAAIEKLVDSDSIVRQLENVLKEKLYKLLEKRTTLMKSGQLNDKAKLEILAEKIAYENIILARIHQALSVSNFSDKSTGHFIRDATETMNLLCNLNEKLHDIRKKEVPQFRNSVDHLTKILTKRLLIAADSSGLKKPVCNFAPALSYLEEKQTEISCLMDTYKLNKLPQLADALALQTISSSNSDTNCNLTSVSNDIIDEVRAMTKEIMDCELVETEISHVMMKTAQLYEDKYSTEQSYLFTFFAYERATLELWAESVQMQLEMELCKNIEELKKTFNRSLNKFQKEDWKKKELQRSSTNVRTLLLEFADVISHKSLIDARINVLKSKYKVVDSDVLDSSDPMLLVCLHNESLSNNLEELGLLDISQTLEAEFKCMLTEYKIECEKSLTRMDLFGIKKILQDLSIQILDLVNYCLGKTIEPLKPIDSTEDIYNQYQQLTKDLAVIKQSIIYIKNTTRSDIGEERLPLYLGTEYLNQVEHLRSAYRRILEECDNRKQQANLESLQVLCEQVLVAMEHWHRKTLQELREQHTRELQVLQKDKEQALAEETQATLAALDAMRKAHEAEVQREVARFKQDFARQQQDELLELTERLSVKCLEAAALEEQLGSVTRQLAHAQQHILQLEKNPQLSLQN
ncbi:putative PH domain protein [Trypoxylus dichotomus]